MTNAFVISFYGIILNIKIRVRTCCHLFLHGGLAQVICYSVEEGVVKAGLWIELRDGDIGSVVH